MGFRDWLGLASASRPLTAAATAVSSSNLRQLEAETSGVSRASAEAWRIWRQVGEIHYVTTQQARLMSRCDWRVEINGEEVETEQGDRLMGVAFGNEAPELARLASIHLQVAGGYYLARFDESDWDVLPYPRQAGASGRNGRKFDDADKYVTVRNPDPVDPKLTDSPVLAALDVARELLLARTQARTASRNRTAQLRTVLYPLEGAGPDTERFEADLTDVITAPMADERSSAAVVPNLIGFPADYIEKWKTIDLTGPIDERLAEKIEGLIRQLAIILDCPPELLTGMGDTNHWSQWAIQEDNWLGHVEPGGKTIGRGFAEAIAAATGLDPLDISVVPDPAPLLKRRPTIADALSAFGAGLVSPAWTRAQLGAGEEDAPDPEPDGPGSGDGGEPPVPEVEGSDDTAPPAITAAAALAMLTERIERMGTPPRTAAPELPFSTDRLLAIDQQLDDSLDDLLALALQRVAEKVGGQIRSRLQGDPDLKAKMADVPNAELAALPGTDYSSLPNINQTIIDTVDSVMAQPFQRVVTRAYVDTRAAGVKVQQDERVTENGYYALSTDAADIARLMLSGEAFEGAAHVAVRRALIIVGGGADPTPPEVAAPAQRLPMPDPLDGAGIALGRGALQWVINNVGVRPRAYLWEHVGGSGNDHPDHQSFQGVEFDGESYEHDGIVWYPGDHAGCRCRRVPLWEETA